MHACSTPGVECRLFVFEIVGFFFDVAQCARRVAGARRSRTCGNHGKAKSQAKSHGSSNLARSLLAAATWFLVCNNSNKLLPRKVEAPPHQYYIPGNGRDNIPVAAVPPSHFNNNAEEKLFCSLNREEFLKDLRKLQTKTKCTDNTVLNFIHLFSKYVGEDEVPTGRKGFHNADRKLKEAAGVNCLVLNGCTKCNKHVFLPSSKLQNCPKCGDARYDTNGKAKEVCLILFACNLLSSRDKIAFLLTNFYFCVCREFFTFH